MSWDNYDFKYDADKVDIPYTGDYDKYLEELLNDMFAKVRGIYAESEFSVTMNYIKFCNGIAEVKKREYIENNRENKINYLLS